MQSHATGFVEIMCNSRFDTEIRQVQILTFLPHSILATFGLCSIDSFDQLTNWNHHDSFDSSVIGGSSCVPNFLRKFNLRSLLICFGRKDKVSPADWLN